MNKNQCPSKGQCERSVVYKAIPKSANNPDKVYYGSTEMEFKCRIYNHRHNFEHQNGKQPTALSKEVCSIKEHGGQPLITWNIQRCIHADRSGSGHCALCLPEKLWILIAGTNSTLNKRSKITAKCHNKAKFKLRNLQPTSSTNTRPSISSPDMNTNV